MSRSEPKPKRRWRPSFGLMFLFSVLLGLGGSVFIRSLMTPAVSPLEKLIAANEPAESVLSLAFAPDGTTLVGTSLGILTGDGKTWSRMEEPNGPVAALVSAADNLYAGGPGGLTVRGKTRLLQTAVTALAVDPSDPQRLLAATPEGLQQSTDGGQTWDKPGAPPEQVLALAVAPQTGRMVAGTIQGTLWYSDDKGQTWASLAAPGGSITSVLFDPYRSGRLWIAAGGRVLYSDDGGNAWQSAKLAVKNRPVVALALSPAGGHDLWGISADGLLQPVTQP